MWNGNAEMAGFCRVTGEHLIDGVRLSNRMRSVNKEGAGRSSGGRRGFDFPPGEMGALFARQFGGLPGAWPELVLRPGQDDLKFGFGWVPASGRTVSSGRGNLNLPEDFPI